jgi:hypothetical protein
MDLQRLTNENKRLYFDLMETRGRTNKIYHDGKAGKEHRELVEYTCKQLQQNKIDFLCKTPFRKPYKGMSDIFILPYSCIVEVKFKERSKSIKNKVLRYPDVTLRVVENREDADRVLREVLEGLDEDI